jgi:hypothetical protein
MAVNSSREPQDGSKLGLMIARDRPDGGTSTIERDRPDGGTSQKIERDRPDGGTSAIERDRPDGGTSHELRRSEKKMRRLSKRSARLADYRR